MAGIESFKRKLRKGKIPPYFFVSHASADNAKIRPIIEQLLDADIQLFFDKPHDIGIDAARFVGQLSTGDRWDEILAEAIGHAHGVIFFPSERYYASEECMRELNVAQYLASTMTDNGYSLFPVCVEPDSLACMLTRPREALLQATRTYVEPNGTVYVLSASYHTYVETLRGQLSSHLARIIHRQDRMVGQAQRQLDGEAGPAQGGEVRRTRPRDYTVPYRVDRTAQRQMARHVHRQVLQTGTDRRPVLICHGEDEDLSERFLRTTLGERLIRVSRDCFSFAEQSKEPIRPEWPKCAISDQETFNSFFTENLMAKFQGAQSLGRGDPLESLARSFADNRTTRVVASMIDTDRSDIKNLKMLEAKITAWANFWDAFPFDTADADGVYTVIPILEIVYDEDRKGGFLSGAPMARKFQKFAEDDSRITNLNRRFESVRVHVLSRFDKITPGFVKEWMLDDEVLFSGLAVSERDALFSELEAVFSGDQALSMSDWSERAIPALESRNIGLNGV